MKGAVIQVALVVFFGYVSSALSAECPPDKDVYPCMCDDDDDEYGTDISLSCNNLRLKKLQKILGHLDKKTSLAIELSQMIDLQTVPSDLFQGLKIKRLEISQSAIDRLSEKGSLPLTGLENSLEELVITSSFSEKNAPTNLKLSHLRKLRSLDLSYNVITKMGNDWFENGPISLTNLILSNNGIEELGDKAFDSLVNLKQLWLDGNRFGGIQRSVLSKPARNLIDFQLDNNAFTSIPEDIFSDMPKLGEVSLRTNGLTKIPQKTLQPVWEQLESLDLRGNSLHCDSELEWMIHSRSMAKVLGTCFSPPDKKGQDLQDFISKKGKN